MMARAYAEPEAAPATAVPNPLMPAFLTMAGCLARLTAELETMRARVCAERAYMRRPDIAPVDKVIALDTAWELGFAPDSPNPDRPREWKPMYRKRVAAHLGVSEARVGATWQAMGAAGWVRRREVHSTDEATGNPRRTIQMAPPEGLAWNQTWAKPATLPPLPKPERLQKDAEKQAGRTKEGRATVAQARQILAQCPDCGSTDIDVVCRSCGTVNHGDEMPGAPTHASDDSSQLDNEDVQLSPYLTDSDESSPPGDEAASDDSSLADDEAAGEVGGPPAPGELTPQEALAAAGRVVAPAVLPFPNHIVMTGEAHPKYLTTPTPLTGELISAHFLGSATYGGGLCWDDPLMTSGRGARGIAWDSDDDFGRLIKAGNLLRRRGCQPLLVKNPTKPNSGHLWLFLDAPVDPVDALARAEQIAPCLREVRERFPNPDVKGGHRIRLPGGRYLPVGAPSVPVLVAQAPEIGAPAWLDGTTPEGWAAIAGAVTHAPDLLVTWVDPAHRPKPPKAPSVQARAATVAQAAGGSGEFFKRFNAENRISEMVRVNRKGFFKSPWHTDTEPSCQVSRGGLWCDYSRDKKGGDAFDLWCALNGFWPDKADKPDRKAAYAFLCPPETRKKDGTG